MFCNHRCAFNGIRQGIIRFLYRLIDWLGEDFTPTPGPSPVDEGGECTWIRYRKLSDAAYDRVAASIESGEKINGSKATATTGWLLWTIARSIDPLANSGEISIEKLVRISKVSRDTITKHMPLLEALGLIRVVRREISTHHKAVNGYALAGAAAEAYVVRPPDRPVRLSSGAVRLSDRKNQQEKIHHHDADDGQAAPAKGKIDLENRETPPAPGDGQREAPAIPQIAQQIGMDALVAQRIVEGHGAALVEAWCHEAARNKGLHSPAAWAVSRIATDMAPPERVDADRAEDTPMDALERHYAAWMAHHAESEYASMFAGVS